MGDRIAFVDAQEPAMNRNELRGSRGSEGAITRYMRFDGSIYESSWITYLRAQKGGPSTIPLSRSISEYGGGGRSSVFGEVPPRILTSPSLVFAPAPNISLHWCATRPLGGSNRRLAMGSIIIDGVWERCFLQAFRSRIDMTAVGGTRPLKLTAKERCYSESITYINYPGGLMCLV
jgi:hypothetical protein